SGRLYRLRQHDEAFQLPVRRARVQFLTRTVDENSHGGDAPEGIRVQRNQASTISPKLHITRAIFHPFADYPTDQAASDMSDSASRIPTGMDSDLAIGRNVLRFKT
ncbi:hypothetical protein, partial [Mesorhizobium sp. M0768]|uniref:hypothetical protein n=1 Tax=Mesorhizobium sp. M0768 TaxID=2956996 RepID=UPI00333D8A2F